MAIEVNVNWLAVLVCGVVHMIIGMIWYNPKVLGSKWMKLSGHKKMGGKNMGMTYLVAFIGALLTSFVLAHFIAYIGANTFVLGMQAGFWAWLGFMATAMLGMVLWEGKPVKLYIIIAGYHLVTMLITGGILAAW
jgi:hypothetical protein